MRPLFKTAMVFACVFAPAAWCQTPLSTSFTYQGELRAGGAAASGLHDLRFRLFDAAAGGSQVGTTLCADNVSVAEGRFTVSLDFLSQFAGQRRYLEIEVRADSGLNCLNPAGFTVLLPRQELTATPNAAFALNAGSATQATTATNSTQLNGQGAAFYQNAANLTSGNIPGARLNGAYPGIVQMVNSGNSFGGSGAGLHTLNASNLASGTIDAARLPMPIYKSGDSGGNASIIGAETTSTAPDAMGLYGYASASTGSVFGVQGRSDSTGGMGVVGYATPPLGNTIGVLGLNASTSGTGMLGVVSAASGSTFGVGGITSSTSGIGVKGQADAATGPTRGVWGSSVSPDGHGVSGGAYALTGSAVGVWGESSSTGGSGVVGYANAASGATRGVYGGVNSPDGRAVYGAASAVTGESSGGYFESASADGTGVVGLGGRIGGNFTMSSTNGYGVVSSATAFTGTTWGGHFSSNSSSGVGVQGNANNSNGSGIGVYGQTHAETGVGVRGHASMVANVVTYGGLFTTYGASGRGVQGTVLNGNNAGTSYGVFGLNYNPNGTGVYGQAAATSGIAVGVRGQSDSPSGIAGSFTGLGSDAVFIQNTGAGRGMHVISPGDTAVWAESTGGLAGVHGATSNVNGFGVLGFNGGTTGNSFGVVGQTGSAAGWGVYAFGRSGASGVKTFRIDHPQDPENKYLLHYSTESPEVLNAYSGTTRLDEAGEAVVELPPYFAMINRDPRYTLTAVGAPMPMLHVAGEIDEAALIAGARAAPGDALPTCAFRIAGGAPGARVSWEVKAVRNDQWVRRNGAPIEIEKQGIEKGTYQHPELYGQPAEKGVHYNATAPHHEPATH
ncbi:hypothetical protein PHYC_02524 [Phycisphaerales bacterium]|nr:hypothetical protein PHYC_02524 [Phycisphaerales bacterium]